MDSLSSCEATESAFSVVSARSDGANVLPGDIPVSE